MIHEVRLERASNLSTSGRDGVRDPRVQPW